MLQLLKRQDCNGGPRDVPANLPIDGSMDPSPLKALGGHQSPERGGQGEHQVAETTGHLQFLKLQDCNGGPRDVPANLPLGGSRDTSPLEAQAIISTAKMDRHGEGFQPVGGFSSEDFGFQNLGGAVKTDGTLGKGESRKSSAQLADTTPALCDRHGEGVQPGGTDSSLDYGVQEARGAGSPAPRGRQAEGFQPAGTAGTTTRSDDYGLQRTRGTVTSGTVPYDRPGRSFQPVGL